MYDEPHVVTSSSETCTSSAGSSVAHDPPIIPPHHNMSHMSHMSQHQMSHDNGMSMAHQNGGMPPQHMRPNMSPPTHSHMSPQHPHMSQNMVSHNGNMSHIVTRPSCNMTTDYTTSALHHQQSQLGRAQLQRFGSESARSPDQGDLNHQLMHSLLESQDVIDKQNDFIADLLYTLYNYGYTHCRVTNGELINLNEYADKGGRLLELHGGDVNSSMSTTSSTTSFVPINQLQSLSLHDSCYASDGDLVVTGYNSHDYNHRTMSGGKRSLPLPGDDKSQLEWLTSITGMRKETPHIDEYISWLRTKPNKNLNMDFANTQRYGRSVSLERYGERPTESDPGCTPTTSTNHASPSSQVKAKDFFNTIAKSLAVKSLTSKSHTSKSNAYRQSRSRPTTMGGMAGVATSGARPRKSLMMRPKTNNQQQVRNKL